MGHRIRLIYSDLRPAARLWRGIEDIASADRRSLGLGFGEPCDPRCLIDLYDVTAIIETVQAWQARWNRILDRTFEGSRWSGVLLPLPSGDQVIAINHYHMLTRRVFTIGHEFGHLALNHRPIAVSSSLPLTNTRYSQAQENEASGYALSILLPYAPLVQMLEQNATLRAIAYHYGVSVSAVEMRLKLTGWWDVYQRRVG